MLIGAQVLGWRSLHSHLELGSDKRKGEAKDEESGKADGDGDLAGGAGGEGNCLSFKTAHHNVGSFEVSKSFPSSIVFYEDSWILTRLIVCVRNKSSGRDVRWLKEMQKEKYESQHGSTNIGPLSGPAA